VNSAPRKKAVLSRDVRMLDVESEHQLADDEEDGRDERPHPDGAV
jgi:hypothetical protein